MNKTLELEGALIGMVHLPPLPGSPRYEGRMPKVVDAALADAEALNTAGVDALILENFGDAPFPRGAAAPETIAALAAIGSRVAISIDIPMGINVLRNDGRAALAVALVTGACFIRVNVLAWARLTDQGIIEGDAYALQRARAALGAKHIKVLADVAVKHSAPLAPVSPTQEAVDVVERALADAVVVTGASTSAPADLEELRDLSTAVSVPVLVGSGVTKETARTVREQASGAIVGSAMMRNGQPGGAVVLDRARHIVAAWKG